MVVKDQTQKLLAKSKRILAQLERKKYDVFLFALIKLEEDAENWELIASFTKEGKDLKQNFFYLVDLVKQNYDKALLKEISKVNLYNTSDPLTALITMAVRIDSGEARMVNTRINNLTIHDAYILKSVNPSAENTPR